MKLVLLLFLLFQFPAQAEEKVLGRKYFQQFLGHVHKNMSKDSTSLTVVQCAHSVKILAYKSLLPEWRFVEVGEDKGFIETKYLGEKRPDCFQGKYPRFYNRIGLDISEMYFWGKLYDKYATGKSKIE